jgi:aminoglycoside phosphotransferase (APT) family kinase protein
MAHVRMHDDEVDVDEELVRLLISSQMPDLAARSLRRVEPWGTDHAIWRLGDDLVVRLPRIHWATEQAEKEARWLPFLAPRLPVTVPEVVALGEPGHGYPYRWAVHRWLAGRSATLERLDDPIAFALSVADVIRSLWELSTDDAPAAVGRARPLREFDEGTRTAIARAGDLIDTVAATRVWEEAMAAPPHAGPAVWVHGDLDGNFLICDGQLCGIVDWGAMCAGDPAVDAQVVWTPLFTPASRRVFLDALEIDDATVARSRGAAVNQACAALPYYLLTYPLIVERSWHKLAAIGVPPNRTA